MKRILIILITTFVIMLFFTNKITKGETINEFFSLETLVNDINLERNTYQKKYSAHIVDKHGDGLILTDESNNYIFAYTDKKTSILSLIGDTIIFEIEDYKKENNIYFVYLNSITTIDNNKEFPDIEQKEIEEVIADLFKKIEINYVNVVEGRVNIDDFSTMNLYDGFSENPYKNGEHRSLTGYAIRKNDVEINFFVVDEKEERPIFDLNVKSLGIKGLSYHNGSCLINGINFEFKEIGDYGSGIQMRSKTNSTNNLSSMIYNTNAFKKPIKRLIISYNEEKTPRNEDHVLKLSFGNTKECKDAAAYLNTKENKKEYVLELKNDFVFINISVPESYGYSSFIDSFIIELGEWFYKILFIA